MSPDPRTGFCLVIHFAADGSAVYITLGCGSTIWNGGDLRAVSDTELIRRTSWARTVVQQHWGSLDPFIPTMQLGAKAPLPRTFEKATALAFQVPTAQLAFTDIEMILHLAAERLGEIYLAQLDLRDVSPGAQDVAAIDEILKPLKRRPNGQGIGLTALERKAVEMQAMKIAVNHMNLLGFQCRDTSSTESFDLLANDDEQTLKIEVKGTTSEICDSILMTRNEIDLHRREKGKTGLLIVYGIQLDKKELTASRGTVEALLCWDIDTWRAEPITFNLSRF